MTTTPITTSLEPAGDQTLAYADFLETIEPDHGLTMAIDQYRLSLDHLNSLMEVLTVVEGKIQSGRASVSAGAGHSGDGRLVAQLRSLEWQRQELGQVLTGVEQHVGASLVTFLRQLGGIAQERYSRGKVELDALHQFAGRIGHNWGQDKDHVIDRLAVEAELMMSAGEHVLQQVDDHLGSTAIRPCHVSTNPTEPNQGQQCKP